MKMIEELYNSEVKEKYLNEIENEYSRKVALQPFRKASRTERMLNKDLYDMNLEEISTIMYDSSFSSESAAYGGTIRIAKYLEWAAENGYRKSNITPFQGIDKTEWSKQFVATYMKSSFTREKILSMCEELYNSTDQAVLLAMFEGIKGKGGSEIINLKIEDIFKEGEQYYVNLCDSEENERTIPISEELNRLLINANREYEYISRNNVDVTAKAPYTKYIDSPYIFKKMARGKQGGGLNASFINRKFMMYKDVFDLKYLTPKNIEDSGIMHMANELYKRDEGFNQKHLHEIGERYNTPKSVASGRNATVVRRILESPDFIDLYEIDINS